VEPNTHVSGTKHTCEWNQTHIAQNVKSQAYLKTVMTFICRAPSVCGINTAGIFLFL